LVRSLRKKFGFDAVLIYGDWSAPNTKFQKLTHNKGFICLLKKNDFIVYHIKEYKTSSRCLRCKKCFRKSLKIS
ncbi:MAG: hypothetical protein EXX96DRAFT_492551, partial [Benjaminiella poitrasii]